MNRYTLPILKFLEELSNELDSNKGNNENKKILKNFLEKKDEDELKNLPESVVTAMDNIFNPKFNFELLFSSKIPDEKLRLLYIKAFKALSICATFKLTDKGEILSSEEQVAWYDFFKRSY